MVVALIIVSACLGIAILYSVTMTKILKSITADIISQQKMEEELLFVEGEIDIPEERIAKKYPKAIMLCHLKKNNQDESTWKIIDTSMYSKNHIIGLTYFVQPQLFEELKAAVNTDALREKARERILQEVDLDDDDMDEDFIDDLIDQAIEELLGEDSYQIDEKYDTMTRPLLPNCTVYQLKDGRWLWRHESS